MKKKIYFHLASFRSQLESASGNTIESICSRERQIVERSAAVILLESIPGLQGSDWSNGFHQIRHQSGYLPTQPTHSAGAQGGTGFGGLRWWQEQVKEQTQTHFLSSKRFGRRALGSDGQLWGSSEQKHAAISSLDFVWERLHGTFTPASTICYMLNMILPSWSSGFSVGVAEVSVWLCYSMPGVQM